MKILIFALTVFNAVFLVGLAEEVNDIRVLARLLALEQGFSVDWMDQ